MPNYLLIQLLKLKPMTKDEILKKYEDDREYHLHESDRQWIMEAMEEYANQQLRLYDVSYRTWKVDEIINLLYKFESVDEAKRWFNEYGS